MPEPITLLEEASPCAPVMGVVETDGTTVYLYLHGAPNSGFGTRALWVANLAPAPDGVDVERMKRGEAPMMPAAATARPEGLRLSDLEPLKLIWFAEGTGAALAGKDGVLAVLPPGTQENDPFPGFARDAVQQTKLAWPMAGPQGVTLRSQVAEAEAFWGTWKAEDTWPKLQERYLAAINSGLGSEGRYFAIDGGEFPPRFLVLRHFAGNTVLVTGGVSILPQPGVARPLATARGPRRIELALALQGEHSEESLGALARYLGAQCQLPWIRASWLGPGHTLGCDLLPVGHSGVRFPAVICAENPEGAPRILFPSFQGDPVHLLWLLPITAAERTVAVEKGSSELFRRLAPLGELWAHRDRGDTGITH